MRPSLLLLLLTGCLGTATPAEHGHSHGAGGHSHGGGADHADHGEEGPTVAITRWADGHELFVELDAPVAGQPFSFHAHVTRIADNAAANSGRFTLRFEQDGFVVESHSEDGVARAGIFSESAAAPQKAGTYRLMMVYEADGERAEWDGGDVIVGDGAAVEHAGEAEGEITFLKETQWQIPFRVEPVARHSLAPTVTASGVVHPDPSDSAVVAAPVDGLVAWGDTPPVVGTRVRAGQRLGTLVPAGAAEHWASLSADLATARIDRDVARSDLARIERLGAGELVSPRRLDEARAAVSRADARVLAAGRRLSALSTGETGAVPIRAPADGLVVQVGAEHGTLAPAGAPLVSVTSEGGVEVVAQVTSRRLTNLRPVASLEVSRPDVAPVDLLAAGGALRTEQLVFDSNTLAAPLVARVPASVGLTPGDLVELSVGVGTGEPLIAVPRSAVVEINGQDVVFVQRTGESFARRRVQLGPADATFVAVQSGLSEGDRVVVEGGFDVHVASLSGALESHRH